MNMCSFGLHKWPKWSAPAQWNGVRVFKVTGQEQEFTVWLQERTCERCGKHQKKEIKSI